MCPRGSSPGLRGVVAERVGGLELRCGHAQPSAFSRRLGVTASGCRRADGPRLSPGPPRSTCACVEYYGKALEALVKGVEVMCIHGKMKFKRNKIFMGFRKLQRWAWRGRRISDRRCPSAWTLPGRRSFPAGARPSPQLPVLSVQRRPAPLCWPSRCAALTSSEAVDFPERL